MKGIYEETPGSYYRNLPTFLKMHGPALKSLSPDQIPGWAQMETSADYHVDGGCTCISTHNHTCTRKHDDLRQRKRSCFVCCVSLKSMKKGKKKKPVFGSTVQTLSAQSKLPVDFPGTCWMCLLCGQSTGSHTGSMWTPATMNPTFRYHCFHDTPPSGSPPQEAGTSRYRTFMWNCQAILRRKKER